MVPRDSHFSADPDLPACQQPSLHPHPVDQYGYPPGFSWHYPGQTEPSYIYHTHPPAQLLVTAPSSGWSHDPPQSIPQASVTNLCPGSGLIDRDIHPNYPIQSAPVYQTHPRAGLVEESQSDIASSEPVVPLSGFQLKVDEFTHSHTEVFEQLNKILGKGQNTKKSERHEMDCIVNCHYQYANPTPLEYHMKIDANIRRDRLFESLAPGDIMKCRVLVKKNHGIVVRLLSFVHMLKNRELVDLRIKGIVVLKNMAEDEKKADELLDELQEQDYVQGVILSIDRKCGQVELSFLAEHLSKDQPHPLPKLGYMDGRRSLSSSYFSHCESGYLDAMERDPAFNNPHCVENLKSLLGQGTDSHFSFLKPILMGQFNEEQFYDVLRKKQRSKWSMESVATGVKLFKSGDLTAAISHFNHALEINEKNVEALVARGALFANKGKYRDAIADFESALMINHSHTNAKKYLVETQTALGQQLEAEGQLKAALHCFQEALADDPEAETAKRKVDLLKSILRKQAADMEEKRRRKEEEKIRMRRLQRIIEKEREREKMGPKLEKRKKKRSKKYKKSRKSSHSRRAYSSSSESTASASSPSLSPPHSHSRHSSHKHSKR